MPSKYQRDRQKRELEDHRKRLKNTTSFLDTRPPREMPMSNRAEMARRAQQAMVNFDNRLLLDRIAAAMNTTNVDNKLIAKPFISVLELQRKKELRKIVTENHHLLNRIQITVPTYDHVKWKKDAKKHVDILRNMTEFPEYFVPPGEHKKGYDMAIVDLERQREKMLKKAFNESLGKSPNSQQQQQQQLQQQQQQHTDNSKLLSRTGGSALTPSLYHNSHDHHQSRGSIGSAGQAKASFSERDYQKYVQKLRNQLQLSRTSSPSPHLNYDSSAVGNMPPNYDIYDESLHHDASANPFDNTTSLHHQPQPHQQYATTTTPMKGSHPSMHSDDGYDLEQDFSRNMHIQDFGRG